MSTYGDASDLVMYLCSVLGYRDVEGGVCDYMNC